MTYEERLAEIEALASKLEAGGLSFEALLNTYERSVVARYIVTFNNMYWR